MLEPKAGSTFDNRYLILEELGQGGMGRVYKARQTDVGRIVAIKFLRHEITDENSISRFYREFKVLAALCDPHIMTFYGLALDSFSRPYAVCEFLEGESLQSVLFKETALNWRRAVKIAIQIAQAMQHAHERGIIHRDLKPANIMLLKSPNDDFVKLVDFGLSGLLSLNSDSESEQAKLTGTGQLLGSPQYMPPEQVTAKPDARGDVYALACIIFEMLAAKPLFEANDTVAVIYKHCNESAALAMPALKGKAPAKLIKLLLCMLEKKPEARPQSMDAVVRELESTLDTPDNEQTYELPERLRSKSSIALAATIMSLVAVAAASAYFVLPNVRKSKQLATNSPKANSLKSISIKTQLLHLKDEIYELHVATTVMKDEKAILRLRQILSEIEVLLKNEKLSPKEKLIAWLSADSGYADLSERDKQLIYNRNTLEFLTSLKTRYLEELCAWHTKATIDNAIGNWDDFTKDVDKMLALINHFQSLTKRGKEVPVLLTINNAASSADLMISQAYYWKATIYFKEQNYKKAADYALRSAKGTKLPDGAWGGWCTYGDSLIKMNKREEALKAVEQFGGTLASTKELEESLDGTSRNWEAGHITLHLYEELSRWFIQCKDEKRALIYQNKASQVKELLDKKRPHLRRK